MYQVSSSTVFFLSVTCTVICIPLKMNWPRLFFCQEIHNFNHGDVHRVTGLYLSTKFVSAALSEIRESNQNRVKKKNNKEEATSFFDKMSNSFTTHKF